MRDGAEIYAGKLSPREAEVRLSGLYRPYHAALAELAAETVRQFGVAVVVDCHSMPSALSVKVTPFMKRSSFCFCSFRVFSILLETVSFGTKAAHAKKESMTIINNIDVPIGSVRDKSTKDVVYDQTQWTTVSDLSRKRFYFRTYDNKDWRVVDVTKALVNAKGIMTITAATPAEYQDITANAKAFGPLPAKYYPAGKP